MQPLAPLRRQAPGVEHARLPRPPSMVFGEETGAASGASTPAAESPRHSDCAGTGPLTSIKAVHRFCSSPQFSDYGKCISYETFSRISGQGFAPWEIHRPQLAVRQLMNDGAFKGAVLDVGCGIGDNSLFIAKYANCTVDAVDWLPRCISFAQMKAGLRSMHGRVAWHNFDVLDLPCSTSPLAGRTFDVVLDSGLLHALGPEAKQRHLQNLHGALRPGGMLYVLAMSDQETSPGGPPRVSRSDFEEVLLTEAAGWAMASLQPHTMELHPTFWGGKAKAYLVAAKRL